MDSSLFICLVIYAVDREVEEASQQLVHTGAGHISHMINACVCEDLTKFIVFHLTV